MGDYAYFRGTRIKIGTCGNLYYLRADQAAQVHGGDVIGDWRGYQFRFPFPDEDERQSGDYEDAFRRIAVPGLQVPSELADEHYSVQFVNASCGYNLALRCPESVPGDDGAGLSVTVQGISVHRNGFAGAVHLSQQKLVEDQLWPILECVCGMKWRVSEPESTELLAALAHRQYDDLAQRVRQGYDREFVTSLMLTCGVR